MPASDSGAAKFVATPWTVVLAAVRGDSIQARGALEKLCSAYWYPLYAFVRREGHSPHDAEDLTQGFFACLIEKRYLDAVNPAKGKFRAFLLAALKHFISDERDRAQAQKRGGGHVFVSFDTQSAEAKYGLEAAHHETPERIFERNWAMALLERVMAALRDEYAADSKTKLFDELKTALTAESGSVPYAEIAVKLDSTEGAVKMAAHRLRHRYRQLLRAEIAHTVASADEIEAEIRHLFAVWSK